MVEFEATGTVGRLWSGYQLAAKIREWHLVRSRDSIGAGTTTIRARVWVADAFWSTQRPLRVELWMGAGQDWWCWDAVIDEEAVIESDKWITVTVEGNPAVRTDKQALEARHGQESIR